MLRKLWAEGMSCSVIAFKLGGGITRNAVIGKVNRLKLERRRTAFQQGKLYQQRRVAHVVKNPKGRSSGISLPKAAFVMKPILVEPVPGRVTIVEVKGCRWPVGHAGKLHVFCDAPQKDGRPYCEFHDKKSQSKNMSGT